MLLQAAKASTPGKGVDGLFEFYKEPSEDVIGPEGIERLCDDLGVAPSDRRVLILAYLMKAERMGFFSRHEFLHGCRILSVTSLSQLKKTLPKLDAAIASPAAFQNFYSFAFQFLLTDPGQKIIDVDTAAQMLHIVYPEGRWVPALCEYLPIQTEYKKIGKDQWENFLKFSSEVLPDLSNATDNPAWPLICDNFCEWYQKKTAAQGGES